MTDSFNPHEILSRLRAKPTTVSNTTNSNLSISSIPPTPTSSTSSLATTTSKPTSKAIKTPAPLTLTAQQRQDNLTVRNELEKEIKKLQDEISALKTENKKLKAEKEESEKQFIEFKTKTDDTITKLRGKIAALTNQKGQCEGTGKVYPPPPPPPTSTGQGAKTNHINKAPGSTPRNTTPINGKVVVVPTNNTKHVNAGESFREPTFSELMRRSTAEQPEFKESLRKIPSSNNAQNMHYQNQYSVNNYPFENMAANGNSRAGGDPYFMGNELKSPLPNYSHHGFSGNLSNNRSNPAANPMFIDHTPPLNNISNDIHQHYGNPKLHSSGNLLYGSSSNLNAGVANGSYNDVMIPGRDDNLVIIPSRKGSIPINNSSSILNFEGGGNGMDIPVVEIDLS